MSNLDIPLNLFMLARISLFLSNRSRAVRLPMRGVK